MKKLLVLVMVLMSNAIFAQSSDFKIEWGKKFPARLALVQDIVDVNEDTIYAVRQNFRIFDKELYIDKYQKMVPKQSQVLEFERKLNTILSKKIIEVGQDLWILSYKQDLDVKELTARFLDRETLQTKGERIPIFNIPMQRRLRYSYGSFNYHYSRDRNRTVFVTEYPGDREESANIGIQVRDEIFDVIWKKEIVLEHSKEFVDLKLSTVSNAGEAFLLLQVFEPSILNKGKRGRKSKYLIKRVSADGEVITHEIKLEDKEISNIHFEVGNNSNLICAGFYGTTEMSVEGAFYLEINHETGEASKLGVKPLGVDFFKQGLTDRKARKLEKRMERGATASLENIRFSDFVIKADGGVVLVGEYLDMPAVSRRDPNSGASSESFYYYKDIVVVNIAANGQILWAKKILKRQYTSDDGGLMSSFALMAHSNKLYFFFNDHIANVDAEKYNEIKTYTRRTSKSAFMLCTITMEGEMTREIIGNQKDLGIEMRPKSFKRISENELILYGLTRKENQFARISFIQN